MSKKQIELVICGRIIGTFSGWDMYDTAAFQFYDFEPVEGFNVPKADNMIVDYEQGIIVVHPNDFEAVIHDVLDTVVIEPSIKTKQFDLIEALQSLPRKNPIERG